MDAATASARRWLETNGDGVVEIVELRADAGHVVRLVTASAIEEIATSDAGQGKRRGIRKWFGRRDG